MSKFNLTDVLENERCVAIVEGTKEKDLRHDARNKRPTSFLQKEQLLGIQVKFNIDPCTNRCAQWGCGA